MMITIVTSIIPLAFKEEFPVFVIIDKIAVVIFIIDYLLRVLTADYKLNKGGLSFILYPITPLALIDLLCILPSLNIISGSFRLLKVFRLFRTFRVFRIFKAVRYSKSIHLIKNVFKTSKKPLITVGFLAAAYVLISALVIFNAEPDTFDTFFDAIYWATVRIVTMVSSIFGIAIIALPSGIITAGLMEEINKRDAVPNTEKDSETTLKKE